MVQKRLVPPDGNWGWAIVAAYSINYSMNVPMMQLFGLLFGDKLKEIGLSATDISVIINTNQAFGMLLGLFNGVLLKILGFRKVAYISSSCIFIGITLTAFANSFWTFLLTYGIIYSAGSGMSLSAMALALNTYFFEKRSKAVGFALTLAGISAIVAPYLVNYLIYSYGLKGAVIILGSITGHTFIAASLLQPVKRHMRVVEVFDDENQEIIAVEQNNHSIDRKVSLSNNKLRKRSVTKSTLSIDHDVDSSSIYGFDSQIYRSTTSLHKEPRLNRKQSLQGSYTSLASVDEEEKIANGKLEILHENEDKIDNQDEAEGNKNKNSFMSCLKSVLNICDLTLLADPLYVNLMLGMSIAIFSELNFSMLTPLMLADFGLNIDQAAVFMSVLAIADLIFRFIAPFIGDYFKRSPRIMYMISLILLALTRFYFITVRSYDMFLISAASLGIAKGFRTIYMSLVIPAYVPLEKLPGASGIQMITNGLLFIAGGPFLGFIKDISGSYKKCVVIMNMMTLLTVAMWTFEIIIIKIKSKRKIIIKEEN